MMAWRFVLSSSLRPPFLYSRPLQSSVSTPAAKERGLPFPNRHMTYGRSHHLRSGTLLACQARQQRGTPQEEQRGTEDGRSLRQLQQAALWTAEAAYILWLFLLPYAPGDPVWAIKSTTVDELLGLSLNFFFILPLMNAVGLHVLEAPVLHPVAEGLFNFIIGWTLLFAPLLYTDCHRDRYKGSLDVLWGFQMFLTNTFLIPYMAIRLNDMDVKPSNSKLSELGLLMTKGSSTVGIIGGIVCLVSVLWAFWGRPDIEFGGIADRWHFFVEYIGEERLAYAFLWDMCLYSIFQPWLIGENLQNVKKSNLSTIRKLRFIPVVGLVAYTLCLEEERNVSQT
ncbi:uncharacterized protein LOC121989272 [Zingiber officinale]|nr:uncharacterized protein LOC121989272 [Zingiber officinale]